MNRIWPTARLGDLVENGELSYGIVQPGAHIDSGIPIVRVKDLRFGRVDESDPLRVDPSISTRHRRTILRGGELLLSIVGTVGESAVVSDSLAGWNVARAIAVIRPREIPARWIHLCLQMPSTKDAIAAALNTTVQATLNLSDLKRLSIPIPPQRERDAIAEVLGALDDKIAANDQCAKLVLSLADTLFQASSQRNPGTPTTLGELVSRGVIALGDGYRTKRSEHGQPGLRILRAGDIWDGRITPGGADFVSNTYSRQIGPKGSQSGDIVLTTKGSVGRVAVVPPNLEQVVYSPQLCYFRVMDENALDASYLAAWFRSVDLQMQASRLMFKSDMAPYINLQDIRSLKLPVPTIDEQRRQGDPQRALLGSFQAAVTENGRLGRIRDELLPLLMSGKVRVRDAARLVEEVV